MNMTTAVGPEIRPAHSLIYSQAEPRALPVVSVVIPTFSSRSDLAERLHEYGTALADVADIVEILCVGGPGTRARVRELQESAGGWGNLVAVESSITASEDEALRIALSRARGDFILTLPGWREIEPEALRSLFAALPGNDLVTGFRTDERRVLLSKARTGTFHFLVRKLFGQRFKDLFCRVRLGRREVFEEASRFGVRQHFIPLLVAWDGYKVEEVALRTPSATAGAQERVLFALGGHFQALVDLITLFVTLKFLQRPLRFFGFIGMPMLAVGLAVSAYLVIARLAGAISLADRPLLTFSVLLIVLGIQIIAIGLVGEIVIYTAARRLKNYEVAEIVRNGRFETLPPGGAVGGSLPPTSAPQDAGSQEERRQAVELTQRRVAIGSR